MKLTVDLGERSYDIIIKQDVLKKAGLLANFTGKTLVVTDDGVPAKYVKTLMAQCADPVLVCLPQGEQSKSIDTWQGLLSRMLEAQFTTHDVVAALGGGMVGDVAGFAAASYMRGISFCQFPTTTLSQVDSSIGGKTAVNLSGTKNVVGAFHQPGIVVIDPSLLKTLPPRHFANGLAEAMKMGLLFSPDLFSLLESGDIDAGIEKILYLSLLYKKGVVERDETDQGERALLNFGHLIGHGIEAASGLNGFLHGECVALGLLPMIENKTLLRRTRAVMRRLGLPLRYTCDAKQVLAHIACDKKREGQTYTVARVKTLGHGYLETISAEELRLLVLGEED